MPKKTTTNPTQPNVINEEQIVNLLTLDFDKIIEEISNNGTIYGVSSINIRLFLNKISQHNQQEKIANNLFALNERDDVPQVIKIIFEAYKKDLYGSKKVTRPQNYEATSIAYIREWQSETSEKIKKSEEKLNKLLNDSKNIRTEFEEKIGKSKDSIILLTVTVLGIFSSLTFSLSGSLSILNNIFSTGNSFAESLFKYSLIGIFVANLIFLLIYTISKMNNKSIAMHCSRCNTISYICQNCDVRRNSDEDKFKFKRECHGCEHKNTSCQECTQKRKTILCKIRHKFYYIYFINIICLTMLIFSFVLGVTGNGNFVFNSNDILSATVNKVENIEPNAEKSEETLIINNEIDENNKEEQKPPTHDEK